MRPTALALALLTLALSGCATFRPGPLGDVKPPRRISIRSPQPFEAKSDGAPACRVTTLTGPYAEVFGDSLFLARVDAFVAAPDQSTPCAFAGRTAVAAAALRGDAKVFSEQFDATGLLVVAAVFLLFIIIELSVNGLDFSLSLTPAP